jgi:glycosyltransferase involved in cell wall biosynthesis
MKSMEEERLKASVCVITYNQAKYIRQTLESIISQKGNIQIEINVSDDCSKDETASIVESLKQNLPENVALNYIRHDRNLGLMKNFIFTLKKSSYEYTAICEGDDYWSDPYKLEKQLIFMKNEPECNYLFTGRFNLESDGSQTQIIHDLPALFDLDYLLKSNVMPSTQTVIFRTGCLNIKEMETLDYAFNGDWVLLFLVASQGKIGYIPFVTAVYRVGVGVISKSSSSYSFLNGLKVNKQLNKLTNYKYNYLIGHYAWHYENITYAWFNENNYLKGFFWFFKTLAYKLKVYGLHDFISRNSIFVKHSLKLIIKRIKA